MAQVPQGCFCIVCGEGEHGTEGVICLDCGRPDKVSVYCIRCGARTYSDPQGEFVRELFGSIRTSYQPIGGLILSFLVRCPICRRADEPELFPWKLSALDQTQTASLTS